MIRKTANPKAVTVREEGAVLLLILLILLLISVLVLSWAQEWRTELKLASNFSESHKCQRLAEAGVYYTLGKLMIAKTAEMANYGANALQPPGAAEDLWQGDQRLHRLELPSGTVEIRIADEAGKINLNNAPEVLLQNFFTQLGLPEPQIRIMVDSIQDWRERGEFPRPYGAKSAYYLRLDPPYVAKQNKFETVEELAWVRGFEASPLIPRLSQWFTVQETVRRINLNTAPLEVLMAVGFSQEAARTIMASRESMPFRNLQDIYQLNSSPLLAGGMQISFRTSPFFTITSTGVVKNNGGHQTIKAIVHVNINQDVPWGILSWYDGYPG
jgi:general secretion pathway protein K